MFYLDLIDINLQMKNGETVDLCFQFNEDLSDKVKHSMKSFRLFLHIGSFAAYFQVSKKWVPTMDVAA